MDSQSKLIVASYPFQGQKLFGDVLEKILIETKEKKKAMLKNLRSTILFSFVPTQLPFEGVRTPDGKGGDNPEHPSGSKRATLDLADSNSIETTKEEWKQNLRRHDSLQIPVGGAVS